MIKQIAFGIIEGVGIVFGTIALILAMLAFIVREFNMCWGLIGVSAFSFGLKAVCKHLGEKEKKKE